jgi:hypothetical protein
MSLRANSLVGDIDLNTGKLNGETDLVLLRQRLRHTPVKDSSGL